jgi:exosortase family protein XrtF
MNILKEYWSAIRFIAIFLGLYLLLNSVYGFYVEYYSPNPDPITKIVTIQVASILALFHDHVGCAEREGFASIPLTISGNTVVNVYEGCNSINVVIVFVSFLIAFTGRLKSTVYFFAIGVVIIYLMNVLRVSLLFEVALNFPDQLYFFHKFLFTGFIYGVVFLLWYKWVRLVQKIEQRPSTNSQ